MDKQVKFMIQVLSVLVGIGLVCLFIFYLGWTNHVGINEIGITIDGNGGEISIQEKPGWYITPFSVKVTSISILPFEVEIPSTAKIINSKIIRFNPDGAKEFFKLENFRYELNSYMPNILMGYAYSGRDWPFLEIIEESMPSVEVSAKDVLPELSDYQE